MDFPNKPDKRSSPGILTASTLLAYRKIDERTILRGATSAVICYQRKTLRWLSKTFDGKTVDGLSGDASVLKNTAAGVVAVAPVGIGAPSLAVTLEELACCGIRKVIAVGVAGSIATSVRPGDVVVPTGTIRDEGTSYHYLPGDLPARPTPELLQDLLRTIRARSIPCAQGAVWTTDAPYRETVDEIVSYRDQGVVAVEMECSALFAVASALGLMSACGLVISDSLSEFRWTPAEDPSVVDGSLRLLSESAVEALRS